MRWLHVLCKWYNKWVDVYIGHMEWNNSQHYMATLYYMWFNSINLVKLIAVSLKGEGKVGNSCGIDNRVWSIDTLEWQPISNQRIIYCENIVANSISRRILHTVFLLPLKNSFVLSSFSQLIYYFYFVKDY